MERKRDYMTVQELTENEKYKFWYFKIKECKESGLSVKDFCDKYSKTFDKVTLTYTPILVIAQKLN